MNLKRCIQNNPLRYLLRSGMKSDAFRRILFTIVVRVIRKLQVRDNPEGYSRQVKLDKMYMIEGLLAGIDRNLKDGIISKDWFGRFTDIVLENSFTYQDGRAATNRRIGINSPYFMVISPDKRCNINCRYCFSNSESDNDTKLDYKIVDRVVHEKKQLWGSYFAILSGGEPFAWKDGGKGIIDLAESHRDQIFLVYTNGTLLNRALVKRIAKTGNMIPAISLEGFEEQTDFHRGQGVHKKILHSFENLRNAGVPFGISATVSCDNYEDIVSERFIDFYFKKQRATFGFIFHYLPIGRTVSMDKFLTPEKRLNLLQWEWRIIKQEKIFLMDFSNCRTATSGCFAAGRPDGHLHLAWNGDVTPCAFIPYSDKNLLEVYEKNGSLDDILVSDLMTRIRSWQIAGGYCNPSSQNNNWLAPCLMRDHNENLHEIIKKSNARPIDSEIVSFISQEKNRAQLTKIAEEYKKLVEQNYNSKYSR